ncbi:MAG TPA: hypothetical protein VHO90_17240, partial [Bacteroidales bacterium]|nr:hypothetical protein [Bacteroidales bacterium]
YFSAENIYKNWQGYFPRRKTSINFFRASFFEGKRLKILLGSFSFEGKRLKILLGTFSSGIIV